MAYDPLHDLTNSCCFFPSLISSCTSLVYWVPTILTSIAVVKLSPWRFITAVFSVWIALSLDIYVAHLFMSFRFLYKCCLSSETFLNLKSWSFPPTCSVSFHVGFSLLISYNYHPIWYILFISFLICLYPMECKLYEERTVVNCIQQSILDI